MNSDLTAAYAAARRSDLLREAEAGRLAASVGQTHGLTKLIVLTGKAWTRRLPDLLHLLHGASRGRKPLGAVVEDRQVETC